MGKPDPRGGLVIRYDYLWASEVADGYADGEKIRPCAVVVALPASSDNPLRAMVCGITHTPPKAPSEGVEIPVAVKRKLGLDDERSWVITSEVNVVDWNDPGIVRTPMGKWDYGYLPSNLMQEVVTRTIANSRSGSLETIDRPEIAKRTASKSI